MGVFALCVFRSARHVANEASCHHPRAPILRCVANVHQADPSSLSRGPRVQCRSHGEERARAVRGARAGSGLVACACILISPYTCKADCTTLPSDTTVITNETTPAYLSAGVCAGLVVQALATVSIALDISRGYKNACYP